MKYDYLVVFIRHDSAEIWVFGYRAGQVLAISDFEQSPSDGFDELGAEVWCV